MEKLKEKQAIPTEVAIRRSSLITVIVDVILIMALVLCLLVYISNNNVETYNQNIGNLTNIATAESELLNAALGNTGHEVESAYKYCRNRTVPEVLDYLSLICGEDDEFQLLRRDETQSSDIYHVYHGYSTKKENGGYHEVLYRDTALATSIYNFSANENGSIAFSQSFTNKTDALRYFAIFCGITVMDENGEAAQFYLVKPQRESYLLNQLQMYTQYQNVSLAVCYSDGKYLACDEGFRSENFYDYLYKYNDLSMDQKNSIRASVLTNESGAGTLTYADYKNRECLFAYATCGDSEKWLVVIAVPVSEFVAEQLLSIFPLTIIGFLVVLLAFNVWRLLNMVGQLRYSVQRERVANMSKSSFLSRMSHEIRTPLNAIIGYNAIAKSSMSDAKSDAERRQAEMKVMDCLDKSEIASKHLLMLINDVLDMSAIESGKIKVAHERFDFRGLVTSLTTVFYSQAKSKGIQFEVVFDTLTEEWFVGDQMRTNQILTNLLSNAVKFTPEGGFVKLKIHQPEADRNAAHIHFDIVDSGIGMKKEYLEHIFTPFEQEDSSISRRFGGTGLGLSITKNLVDLMGGTITVKSVHGEGTTFGVDITFERTEQPNKGAVPSFDSINALIVDDDQSTCDYMRLLFNRYGARCTTVTSGEAALKAFAFAKEQGDEYTMFLVDWQMPDMDGIETIKRMRSLAGDTLPITVLSAYDYSEIADEASAVGVNKFVSKPLFQSTLFDLLANQGGKQRKTVPSKKAFNFAGARVLIAEDNAMNMEIATMLLKSTGIVTDNVWNGKEALDTFSASTEGTYSAILMDIHMPVMNGHEATRAIRASAHPQAKTIPIIAMTADAFAENVAEAHASGMNDHIAKPINVTMLYEVLNKYMNENN